MTSIVNTSDRDPIHPTPWRDLDIVQGVEVRQTSDDTWQLRTLKHYVTLNREAFDYYLDGDMELFGEWMHKNKIEYQVRKPDSFGDKV